MGQLTQFTSVFIIILVWCYKVGITGERCLGSNTEEGIASVTFALFVNMNYLSLFGSMFARAYYPSPVKKDA